MKSTVSRVLAGLVAVLAACTLAYEHDWPVWGTKGTFGNNCRKIVRLPSAAAPQAQDHIHLVFSNTSGPTQYDFSLNGGLSWNGPFAIPYGYTEWCNEYPSLQVDPGVDRPWSVHFEQGWEDYGPVADILRASDPVPDWRLMSPGVGSFMLNSLALDEGVSAEDPSMGYLVTTLVGETPGTDQVRSYLYFFAFDTLRPWPPYVSQCLSSATDIWDFRPTIDYTPGGRVHVAWQDRGGEIWYETWEEHYERAAIRTGQVVPEWIGPYRVSDQSTEPASEPSLDADGDLVLCAFRGRNTLGQNIGEVWRAQRSLDVNPPVWEPPVNISNSPERESRHPQCQTRTTVTWHEWFPPADTEVLAAFPGTIQNVSQNPDPTVLCRFPHGAVRNPVPPEPFAFTLHALWSKFGPENERTVHYKRFRYIPTFAGGQEYPCYLSSELGVSRQSPYCVSRDGFREYRDARVDYADAELKYVLPYLSPVRHYLVELVFYNGEADSIRQELRIGDRTVVHPLLKPGVCETLRLRLPPAAYRTTRAELVLKRVSGRFACLANSIKVYEVDPPEGDGPMGAGTGLPEPAVRAWPNPFRSSCAFSFPATGDASASIYDANGRLVCVLPFRRDRTNSGSAVWNGRDAAGIPVSPGIYYCILTAAGSRTRIKVVRQ